MKILLIYPPSWIRYNFLPPLGTAVVASTLKNQGYQVKQVNIELDILSDKFFEFSSVDLRWIVDEKVVKQFLNGGTPSELNDFINYLSHYEEWNNYDVVGFSAVGKLQVISSAVIGEYIKRVNPKIRTILGGVFPSTTLGETLQMLHEFGARSIDIIYPFNDAGKNLAKILRSNRLFNSCKSIRYMLMLGNDDYLGITNYPVPCFDFSPQQQLKLVRSIYGISSSYPMLQYLVTDGCIGQCIFCTRRQRRISFKHPRKTAEELSYLNKQYNISLFKLECNLINPNKKWLKSLCEELLLNKTKIYWNAYARVVPMDLEIAKILKRSGCLMLRFGVESGSDKVLKILKKGYTVKDVEATLRATKRAGIWNGVLFMVGIPGETEKDVEQTVEFIKRNRKYIDSAIVNVFCLLEGTLLHREPWRFNIKVIKEPETGAIGFEDLTTGRSWDAQKKFSYEAHERIVEVLIKEGVGLVGTSVDLMHWAIFRFCNHEKAHQFLVSSHPHFVQPFPHHLQRWLLYHPSEELPFPDYKSPLFSLRLGYSGIKTGYEFSKSYIEPTERSGKIG